MHSRRNFIKSAAVTGATVLLNPWKSLRGYGADPDLNRTELLTTILADCAMSFNAELSPPA